MARTNCNLWASQFEEMLFTSSLPDLLFRKLNLLATTTSIAYRIASTFKKSLAPCAVIFRFNHSRTMELYGHLMIRLLILTVSMIHGNHIVVQAQRTSFRYLAFSSPDNFTMVGDVQYYEAKNSFLLNSGAQSLGLNSCGRLYYRDRVRMKDAASGAVASFNTSFTFSITRINFITDDSEADGYSHADGMAFTFGRDNDSLVGDLEGGFLCLVTAASNGHDSNQLFAVEFDTFRNPTLGDPSNNHIGIDINSVNSKWIYNLCGGTVGNCTYLVNGGSFTAWIDYDSPSEKLAVYFANGSLTTYIPKPPEPVINATQSLADLVDNYMYVGFTGSIHRDEVHEIQAWQFATTGLPEVVAMTNSGTSSSRGRKAGIIAGIGAGVGVVLLLAGIVFAKRWRRASHTKQGTKFNLMDQNLVPRVFTFEELTKATMNFSRSERFGSGGFGVVYKGVLPSGVLVAVKRMRHESKHGEEGFQAEAASLSQILHRNLVQLRGWCHEEEQLLLVYDFMCNGSLDEWLFQFPERNAKAQSLELRLAESLPLMLRHSILSGVAAALSYLHEDCKQCVLHRDIKSSNVLLDEDLTAHLGDFGLARLIDHQKMEKTTVMAGTLGYMAPEILVTWKATKESDVFSFGVLMLEVMCGMRPLDTSAIERGDGALVDRIWHAHETGNILLWVDPRLGSGTFPPPDADPYGGIEMQEASGLLICEEIVDLNPSARHNSNAAMEDQKMVTNLLHLGLLCCHPNPESRPSMRQVSQWLQASESMEMSLPPLPACRPHGRYFGRKLSAMAMIRSVPTSVASVKPDNVQDAGQGSSQTTLPMPMLRSGSVGVSRRPLPRAPHSNQSPRNPKPLIQRT